MNIIVITDVESDDVVSLLLMLEHTENYKNYSNVYILTTDYNTYIKKKEIQVLLKYFNLKKTLINIGNLKARCNKKYKKEGRDVIDNMVKDYSFNYDDNHNKNVKEDLHNWMVDKDDVDVLILANMQDTMDIFDNIFDKFRYIIMYGGRKYNTISYNWERSVDDVNRLLYKAREYGKKVYIMTPDVVYGNKEPGVLSVYNENEGITKTYTKLMKNISTYYPKIRKIIENWNDNVGIKFCHKKTAPHIPIEIFKEEIKESLQMTPADICAVVMYISLINGEMEHFTFNSFENMNIIDKKLVAEEGDNDIYYVCTSSSNDNFINKINKLNIFLLGSKTDDIVPEPMYRYSVWMDI